MIEKSTELGLRKFLPTFSDKTQTKTVSLSRCKKNIIEAVEQCGGTFIPEILPIVSLARVIEELPEVILYKYEPLSRFETFILILCFLLPFTLAYLIKTTQISIFITFIIIILFTILVVSYLNKNNRYAQFSLKSFLFKTKKKN